MTTHCIGIVAYFSPEDLVQCLHAIQRSTPGPHKVLVHDNTEVSSINVDVVKMAFPQYEIWLNKNVGCSVSRNRIVARLLESHPSTEFITIMDQDIRVQPGWLEDALEVFQTYPNTGMVTWPCLNMGEFLPRQDGVIALAPGACCVYRVRALLECGGWDPTFFMYRFDSLVCVRMIQEGWRVRLVMKHHDWKKPPNAQEGRGVLHFQPHRGVRRNPHWREYQHQSLRYYEGLRHDEGWEEWDPHAEPRELWNAFPGVKYAPRHGYIGPRPLRELLTKQEAIR